ncbi:MAG: Zn-dependent oligopeptidase [Chloroflexota bacterium]|nr:Zn-dependent oligopeptidase [Chloroflexota bacterium]MDE2896071.1 Zn-dependent oligopeptidase [Chloroflexota bacterium]
MTIETPNWAETTSDDIERGVDEAIRTVERLADELVSVPDGRRSFENTVLPLDEISNVFNQASGRFGFLSQVSADEDVRAVAHRQEERLNVFAAGIGFREDIDRALKAYATRAELEALPDDARRLLEFALRDYRRNGLDLDQETRDELQSLQERLVGLGIEFRKKIDDYEDHIEVSRAELDGLPDAYIERLSTVEVNGAVRYRVGLDYPELHPFLDAAHDGERRRELFYKNHNKAADTNIDILEEALGVRSSMATLLGFESWAAYALEIKMAKQADAVLEFLEDLEERLQSKLAADLTRLSAQQERRTGFGGPIGISDWRYYTNQVIQEDYQVDPFEVAAYFPLDAVLDGMFRIYEELVGVRFVRRPDVADSAWHEDAQPFDIVEPASGEALARFYMDLYPRPGKFGHAAAFTLRGGRRLGDDGYQRPISAIVANFTKPTESSPSLLRHTEVVTLFHEFGHILHQTLTNSRYTRFSGTRVERDFVEAPSQMLEHWCWQPNMLSSFSRHYESGDPLPKSLINRMIEARHTSSAIATLRQVYFSRLDLAYHTESGRSTDEIARELHPITGFPFPEDTHFQAGFGHLFGYDAGYYGYLWSRVFGDDMFTRFEAPGASVSSVGAEYRRHILEPGGTADADQLIHRFLGREPNADAFLRELGLAT